MGLCGRKDKTGTHLTEYEVLCCKNGSQYTRQSPSPPLDYWTLIFLFPALSMYENFQN